MTPSTPARTGVLAVTILVVFAALAVVAAQPAAGQDFRSTFDVNKAGLADRGQNAYFILEPGYRQHFQHGSDALVITVLDDTKVVDGVTTRVVEERETKGGELAEVSRNYFAIDRTTDDVYYFGEDVDEYKNGKISGHEGAWLSGVNGARFGLMMPGTPKVGDRYYQEYAPKAAMDRAEILSVTAEMKVAAGAYRNCLHTRESSAIERSSEGKWYAPGVGLIKDADFELVKIEKAK
jgi:hypothetical protein